MSNYFSQRGDVKSLAQQFNTRAAELIKEGKPVIKMHLGQPSTPLPDAAFQKMCQVDRAELSAYSSGLGVQALRERIAQHYKEQYNVDMSAERIAVSVGASVALMMALISCFDVGDKIAMPYPVYPAYVETMKMLGLEIVPIATTFENNFQVTVEQIQALDEKVHGMIIASPSNPAGSIMPPDVLEAVVGYCDDNHIRLISDEIYHGLVYPGAPEVASAAQFSDNVIIINSFSKYFSMPGWRVGWLVLPEELTERVASEARNLYLAAPTPSQYAAMAAMDCHKELDQYLETYKVNRELMLKKLPKAGFDRFSAPDGAFYMYVHIQHLHHDSKEFCMDLLNTAYITSMPGTSFDPHHGHHFVRFSYAGATAEIDEALDRMIDFCERYPNRNVK